jgi:hypothetical protein
MVEVVSKKGGCLGGRGARVGVGIVTMILLAACGSTSHGSRSTSRTIPQFSSTTGSVPNSPSTTAPVTSVTPPVAPTSTGPSSTSSTSPAVSDTLSAAPPTSPTATIGDWTGTVPYLIYFSGDAGNIVSGITWSSWDATSATGQGTWEYLTCQPNCAQGPSTRYPAMLVFSEPRNGHFTRLTERQTGPHGHTYVYALPDTALSGACSRLDLGECGLS